MLFNRTKYKRLIVKMIQGEVTPEEQRMAEQWISRSRENRRLYENYRDLLLLTDQKKVNYDTDKAWNILEQRISASESQGRSPVRKLRQQRMRTIRYAAISGAAALLLVALALFPLLNRQPEHKSFATAGEISGNYKLPDGSVVVLNTNSAVNYPERFQRHSREISIFGEAFFEIKPDATRPFIIHASGLDIKVVGTSFTVAADPEQAFVKVTVNTGKVLVYPSGFTDEKAASASHLLEAGEMATYSTESGQITKGVNDDLNFLSWKTGILVFREARLAEVFKALENKYNIRFADAKPDLLNQRLTARFENESLNQVLETLSLIFNTEFSIHGAEVMVH